MVKIAKNRVVPSRNLESTVPGIENDPFFGSTSSKSEKKSFKPDKNEKSFGKNKSFEHKKRNFDPDKQNSSEKPKFNKDKFFGKSRKGVDTLSKNIKKAKDLGKPNFKSDNFSQKTKFDQKRPKVQIQNKKGPKLESRVSNEKFKKIEEDSDFKKSKNTCKAVVKYEGPPKDKKPFDKKKWRLQKYSKKYKLEQWEEKRKKAVLNEYYKQTKDDNSKTDVQKIYEQYDSDQESQPVRKNYVQNPDYQPPVNKKTKKNTKLKVKLELERLKQEKELKKEEFLKKKQEKEEALKEYKQNKMKKQKLLNKKTKRGQPVMKGRIEMLLEKIQKS